MVEKALSRPARECKSMRVITEVLKCYTARRYRESEAASTQCERVAKSPEIRDDCARPGPRRFINSCFGPASITASVVEGLQSRPPLKRSARG